MPVPAKRPFCGKRRKNRNNATLYVLGGANGVGKTTWYNYGIEQGYIEPSLPFINLDNIQKELGGYSAENALKAEGIAREKMLDLITRRQDFMIESNLAKAADYDWIERLRKQGYETHLFFLSTIDVSINKQRVAQRVTEGGHSVPEAIIEHRYKIGLSYIKTRILDFTDAKLIDTSSPKPKVMAVLKNGQILSKELECPGWVNDALHIAERLRQKQTGNKLLRNKGSEQSPGEKINRKRGY